MYICCHGISSLDSSVFSSIRRANEGLLLSLFGVTLYGLCIWSYSVAVFTDPGSPIEAVRVLPIHKLHDLILSLQDNGYSYLPTYQASSYDPTIPSNLTVKNDGRARYCQKCNYMKPDRTHHCSICRRCTLKMDHHCPWLGNCIGFANYKAFVLFLIYLSLFCLECCLLSSLSLYLWITYVTPVRLFFMLMRTRITFPCNGYCWLSSQVSSQSPLAASQ
jgi:hypothetical protein